MASSEYRACFRGHVPWWARKLFTMLAWNGVLIVAVWRPFPEGESVKSATLAQRGILPSAGIKSIATVWRGIPLCCQPKAQSVQFQRFRRNFPVLPLLLANILINLLIHNIKSALFFSLLILAICTTWTKSLHMCIFIKLRKLQRSDYFHLISHDVLQLLRGTS